MRHISGLVQRLSDSVQNAGLFLSPDRSGICNLTPVPGGIIEIVRQRCRSPAAERLFADLLRCDRAHDRYVVPGSCDGSIQIAPPVLSQYMRKLMAARISGHRNGQEDVLPLISLCVSYIRHNEFFLRRFDPLGKQAVPRIFLLEQFFYSHTLVITEGDHSDGAFFILILGVQSENLPDNGSCLRLVHMAFAVIFTVRDIHILNAFDLLHR